MRTIFNTTYIVDETIETEWLQSMQTGYIAYIRRHSLAEDIIFTKVSIDQPEGKTYSLQLVFGNPEDLEKFREQHLDHLEKSCEQYRNRYLCFSSLLTEI